jgi:hypothetical protein
MNKTELEIYVEEIEFSDYEILEDAGRLNKFNVNIKLTGAVAGQINRDHARGPGGTVFLKVGERTTKLILTTHRAKFPENMDLRKLNDPKK